MSPTRMIEERVTRAHLARLRRSIGVTGYELPGEERYRSTQTAAAVLCGLGVVVTLFIGATLALGLLN